MKIAENQNFNITSLVKLRAELARLELNIPLSKNLKVLSDPVNIGTRQMPNRFCVQPMEGCDAEPDGTPSPLTRRRYIRYASGGAGLIWMEATAIMPNSRSKPHQLCLTKETLPAFKEFINEIRKTAISKRNHNILIIVQLAYPGRSITIDGIPRPVIVHHNPMLDRNAGIPDTFNLASDSELETIRDCFITAANVAAEAGFDGIDIKTCHNDILAELLAAHTRPGKYGGLFENRTRLLRDIFTGIRQQNPNLILSTRTSFYDGSPYPYSFGVNANNPNETDLIEPLMLANIFVQAGVNIVNISPNASDGYTDSLHSSCENDTTMIEIARKLSLVKNIREAIPNMHIVAGNISWFRQLMPYIAAGIIESGTASIIGLGRSVLAYPSIVSDLTNHCKINLNKICIMCKVCLYLVRNKRPAGCVIRDADFYKNSLHSSDKEKLKNMF